MSRLPGFVLLGGFIDSLLVVSILGVGGVRARGGGELVGCAESREFGASAHHLPRFVVLGNFSDTLLVVSILDMVYDFVSGFAVLKGLNSEHLF